MTAWFSKVLFLAAALALGGCSRSLPFGGKDGKADAVVVDAGRTSVSPPEETEASARVLGSERLLGFTNFEVTEGTPVATDEMGALLKLPTGIVAKGASFLFRAKADIPPETINEVEFQIPFEGGLNDNLVVMFRLLPVGDAAPVVGIIPLSYLKVDAEAGVVAFKPRGLGDYQAAYTPERVVRPLTTNSEGLGIDDSVPVAVNPKLTRIGALDLAGFFGLDATEAYAYLVGDTGVRVVDLANPAALIQSGMLSNANGQFGPGRAAKLSGNLLVHVTTNGNNGGQGVFSLTTPTTPVFRSGVADAPSRDVVLVGNVGIAAISTGLRIFTFAGGAVMQGNVTPQTGGCNGITGDNRFVAAVCASSVIGINTNNLPLLAAGFAIDNAMGGRGVAVSGNYVYVVGDDGLRIYDVTQQNAVTKVGTLSFPGGSQIAVAGNLALVVTATEARLIDVTNKAAPGFFNANDNFPVTNGRRVKFLPGSASKALILDEIGLKYVEIK